MRSRSREQVENNDYARRFRQMLQSNVVGPDGILLQSRLVNARGNLTKPINDAVEWAWYRWGMPEHCHIVGHSSWADLQRQIITSVAEDGEAFIRLIRTGRYGLQLQLIDPEYIPIELERDARQGAGRIRMGIEYDAWDRPVAYWMTDSQGDYYYGAGRYQRIPADEIVHAFVPFRSGALRGLPWMSSALLTLHMMDQYADAAVVNARMGAAKMGFICSESGEAPPLTGRDSDGGPEIDAEPGTFPVLPDGYRVEKFETQYPNGEFGDFMKVLARKVAAGLNVNYASLAGDLSDANYSSLKHGVAEEREFWRTLQNWMIDAVCRRVFRAWLDRAALRHQIKGVDPTMTDALVEAATWQARRWEWVDKLDGVKADLLAVNARTRSLSEIIRESGRDPDDVWLEIQRDQERLKALGIEPVPQNPGYQQTGTTEPQTDESDQKAA